MAPPGPAALVAETFREWHQDKATRLAAALAYYALFSLAPLLVIAIAIAGLVFGREVAETEVIAQLRGLMGDAGADLVQELIRSIGWERAGRLATALAAGVLLAGAAGFLGQLQDALNTIWEVRPRPHVGVLVRLRKRFLSFGMVLGTGFLLLVSLVISAGLAAAGRYVETLVSGSTAVWSAIHFLVALAVTTILFALIFKIVPDARVGWRDVWVGAIVAALLFGFGRTAIGLYLGRSSFVSAYGAAASLVVLVVWVYYSAQILFFGAEFTQVYARRAGRHIRPERFAEAVPDSDRAAEGIPRR